MACLEMYSAAASLKTPFVIFVGDDEFTQNVYRGIVSQLNGTECGEAERDSRPEKRCAEIMAVNVNRGEFFRVNSPPGCRLATYLQVKSCA